MLDEETKETEKKTVTATAKEASKAIVTEKIKKKVIVWSLAALAGCAPVLLALLGAIIISCSIFGFLNLDLGIDIQAFDSGGSLYAYIASTYSNCEAVTVNGKIYKLNDYVSRVITQEANTNEEKEALKAEAVVARTDILIKTRGGAEAYNISVNQDTESLLTTNNKPKAKVSFLNKIDDSSKVKKVNKSILEKLATEPSEVAKNAANETEGIVILKYYDLYEVSSSSTCEGKENCTEENNSIANYDELYKQAQSGKKYDEIIKEVYSDSTEILDLNDLKVGIVTEESGEAYKSTYTNVKSGKTYKNFKQVLYDRNKYQSLHDTGCGITSSAIVLSPYNASITPLKLYNARGYAWGANFGVYKAKYKAYSAYPDKNGDGWADGTVESSKLSNSNKKQELIDNLNKGGTAILFIQKKYDSCGTINGDRWTGSQHYFAVLDYNAADNTVYVSNPGTLSKRQNGWIKLDSFNCAHVVYLIYPQDK